ncbi:hypothetical protein [Actinocorallia longicatena]|uniref:Uncharacterized protein n=1 Tax=Actinocorallia longicatena TaxID=111803 RepID=A0ABP6Q318_9ACTN
MANGSFQIPPGFALTTLSGLIRAEVVDVNGNPPGNVIKADQDFAIKYEWELSGTAVPMICGKWLLRVLHDEVGGPGDGYLPNPPREVALTPGNGVYTETINVPGGLPASPGGSTYQIIASISYLNGVGSPGGMGGNVDCGLINIVP